MGQDKAIGDDKNEAQQALFMFSRDSHVYSIPFTQHGGINYYVPNLATLIYENEYVMIL
jgi:hypothetical protein